MTTRFSQKKADESGYTRQDWNEVSDNPPITKADMAKAKPFSEVFPELHESIQRGRGRPRSEDPREAVTLRLPRSVLEKWKQSPDWRLRMEEALTKSA